MSQTFFNWVSNHVNYLLTFFWKLQKNDSFILNLFSFLKDGNGGIIWKDGAIHVRNKSNFSFFNTRFKDQLCRHSFHMKRLADGTITFKSFFTDDELSSILIIRYNEYKKRGTCKENFIENLVCMLKEEEIKGIVKFTSGKLC